MILALAIMVSASGLRLKLRRRACGVRRAHAIVRGRRSADLVLAKCTVRDRVAVRAARLVLPVRQAITRTAHGAPCNSGESASSAGITRPASRRALGLAFRARNTGAGG